jgi:hypothetical protein
MYKIDSRLDIVNPTLAKQWHPIKNGKLHPSDTSIHYNKKVWWKCPKGDDHVWEASVYLRNKGVGCPICSNHKIVESNCLATLNPNLAAEWHPTKNGNLTPFDVGAGASKKVWWKCSKAHDHDWEASISSRKNGAACPICSNHKIVESNCLAILNPNLAAEWHPTKNGNLTPFDVGAGTSKKVWWKCPKGDDHEWEAIIESRTRYNHGCSVCSNITIVKSNCLATLNPKLGAEWHPIKNGNLTPFDVGVNSHKKVWWKCSKGDGHEWEAAIISRNIKGAGCPICVNQKIIKSNSLAVLNPKLAAEWHPTKNGNLTPFDVGMGSNKKAWWKCSKCSNYEWEASTSSRTSKGNNCPACAGKIVTKDNCLETTHPLLSAEWHPTKNNLKPDDVTFGYGKKVWWKCPKGDDHVWQASPNTRSNMGNGCPICSGMKAVKSNCLATIKPHIAKQWHPTKNGKLTPFDVTPFSNKKIWWKCPKGDDHEWEVTVGDRSSGRNCTICSGNKVVKSNCLETKNPVLAKQWHPTKNINLKPSDVTEFSNKMAWWKCPKGDDHVWKSSVANRSKGKNCPVCAGQKVVTSNCLATLNPKLAAEWHPIKNGNKTPSQYTLNSGTKVWWKCSNDESHEWISIIYQRSRTDCPYCSLTPQSKQELTITFELIKIFKNINPKGFKTKVNGKIRSIDIFIPELNLGIEFDGAYWHKDNEDLDKLKTEQLNQLGFDIVRIRQKPLKQIFMSDILVNKKFDGKYITDMVLKYINNTYNIDIRTRSKIEKYLSLKDIHNQKALDKYIQQILEEKSTQNDKKLNANR